jgi:hypothetical protein
MSAPIRSFQGEVTPTSRCSFLAPRDYYGQVPGDYVNDYHASCLHLMRAGISYDVVTGIPSAGRTRRFVLSSAVCLSAEERNALAGFMADGGTVIATGPCGFCDQRATPAARPWLHELGVAVEWFDPPRTGGFSPYKHYREPVELAECRASPEARRAMKDGRCEVIVWGRLWWRPGRWRELRRQSSRYCARPPESEWTLGLPAGAGAAIPRRRPLANSRLPAKVGTVLHHHCRIRWIGAQIENCSSAAGRRNERATRRLLRVWCHSPDLVDAPRVGAGGDGP